MNASLYSTFLAADIVSIDFTAGQAPDAHTDFRVQHVEILITPENPAPSSGEAVGFNKGSGELRTGGFGAVDPEAFSAFGSSFEVLQFEQTNGAMQFSTSPCPTTWELHSLRIDELNASGLYVSGATSTSVIVLQYVCLENKATWTASGVTVHALGGTQGGGTINMKLVTLRLHSLYISVGSPGDDTKDGGVGVHRRGSIKGTICALPDMILGGGFCGPLMVFIPPLVLVVVLLGVGVSSPIVLAGVGITAMVGMAAIVLPGPIMIVAFVVAAAGSGAFVLMMRR